MFKKLLVFFLVLNILSQGLLTKSGADWPTKRGFANLNLIHCKDPEHSHPPMDPPGSSEEAHTFPFSQKDFAPAILCCSDSVRVPIKFASFWQDHFSRGTFNDHIYSARDPPLLEV